MTIPNNSNGAAVFRVSGLLISVIFVATSAVSTLSHAASSWSSTTAYPPYVKEVHGRPHSVTASTPDRDAALRTYTLQSTIEQRDNGATERVFIEQADRPRVRSGSVLFDALFAMALDDARLNSVRVIHDAAYDAGRAIDCECFETGEKWTYVWTRDLAYAADLGLADLDPQRVVNSLLFKTSGFRDGVDAPATLPAGSLQIIQDTGSGGSWPVSTDRVAWALGAEAALANLAPESRGRFAAQVYAALLGTLEADREAAFDARDGLYGGEQSFLDWRDQTYAPWIVDDLSHMAQSKALSTNVVHYRALRLAQRLATQNGQADRALRYGQWATDLQRAINDHFWLDDVKLYASLTTSDLQAAPVRKFDMLGTALAIVSDVAPMDRARETLARYPHAPFGVPVYFPQQPDEFVYHNRAIWPFVTAYALKAAARTHNAAVASRAVDSLMRAAALNLSNMENLEWLTGRAEYDDGPRINSRRQLWSVGGYFGMVTETIFGYHVENGGLRIDPFLTTEVRRALGDTDSAVLQGLSYLGRPISITLRLPHAAPMQGYYTVASITLNGRRVRGLITEANLATSQNAIEVAFSATFVPDDRVTMIPAVAPLSHTDPQVFSPRTPVVSVEGRKAGGAATLRIDTDLSGVGESVTYNVYRDGVLTAAGLKERYWVDKDPEAASFRRCYTVEAMFASSGNRSHQSRPACLDNGSSQIITADDSRIKSRGKIVPASATVTGSTLQDWPKDNSVVVVSPITIERDGDYVIRFIYDNHEYAENTGITNAVKRLRVLDMKGVETAHGIVQMPHIRPNGQLHPLRESTSVVAPLKAGRYQLELSDYFNMSYLRANRLYANSGGLMGPVNVAGLAQIRIERVQMAPSARSESRRTGKQQSAGR